MRHKICKWASGYVTDFHPIKSLVTKLVLNVIKPERPSRRVSSHSSLIPNKLISSQFFIYLIKCFNYFFLWLIPLAGLRPSWGYIYQESTISFNPRIIRLLITLYLGLHTSLVHGLYWITILVSVFYIPWNLFN